MSFRHTTVARLSDIRRETGFDYIRRETTTAVRRLERTNSRMIHGANNTRIERNKTVRGDLLVYNIAVATVVTVWCPLS